METYSVKESVVATELDGTSVLLDLDAGSYFSLNAVGAFVWQNLATPATIEKLSEAVSSQFDVSAETCIDDIYHLLSAMRERGLVVCKPTSIV